MLLIGLFVAGFVISTMAQPSGKRIVKLRCLHEVGLQFLTISQSCIAYCSFIFIKSQNKLTGY